MRRDEIGWAQLPEAGPGGAAAVGASRIRDIECLVLARRYAFVLVRTEDGLTGIGEADMFAAELVPAAVELVKPILLGRNALDVGALWDTMWQVGQRVGFPGAGPAAAAIDIALWDILGKALGVPVHRLLGGKRRDRVQFYASSMRRDLSIPQEVQRAAGLVDRGWRAYKLHGAVPGSIDAAGDRTVATVSALRAELGPDIALLVDVNGAYSRHHAITVGRQLQDLGVAHFEEPVPGHDLDGLAAVADALDVPVAAGERCYTRWHFLDLAQRGRVDILQPTALRLGGMTELQSVGALAAAVHRPVTLHNIQPTVAAAAHLHFCAAAAELPYPQEWNIEPVLIRDEQPILTTPLAVEPGGFVTVPDGPGLGVEVDLKLMRKLADA